MRLWCIALINNWNVNCRFLVEIKKYFFLKIWKSTHHFLFSCIPEHLRSSIPPPVALLEWESFFGRGIKFLVYIKHVTYTRFLRSMIRISGSGCSFFRFHVRIKKNMNRIFSHRFYLFTYERTKYFDIFQFHSANIERKLFNLSDRIRIRISFLATSWYLY